MTLLLSTDEFLLTDNFCSQGTYSAECLKIIEVEGGAIALAGNPLAWDIITSLCPGTVNGSYLKSLLFCDKFFNNRCYPVISKAHTIIRYFPDDNDEIGFDLQCRDKQVCLHTEYFAPEGNAKTYLNYLRPVVHAFDSSDDVDVIRKMIKASLIDWMRCENGLDLKDWTCANPDFCYGSVRFKNGDTKLLMFDDFITYIHLYFDFMRYKIVC
jgi:hypothetical protein